MAKKPVLGWWFCDPDASGVVRLPHRDGRVVKVGETLKVEGKIVSCERGLHASIRAIDALKYAPGSTVCRVRLGGTIVKADDKVAASERTVLWMVDAGTTLRLFACDCDDAALHAERKAGREPDPRTWEAVRVGRLFAIGKASEAERSAAESAAWSAQNKILTKALLALGDKS